MINLLFTSAGRRVELIQEFIRARKEKSIEGKIVCADMSELAPALYFADQAYTVPSIFDPNYLEQLLDICKKEQIRVMIPTIDTELDILSNNVSVFQEAGTEVLISSPETVKISQDKMKTFHFFKSIGLRTPESYIQGMEYRGTFPCFIKPKHGSSSINAIKINNQTELDFFKSYIGDYIIQDFIEGPEYTIDIFCDFEGNPIYLTPRLRLATRSGEVMKTRVVYDDNLENQVLRIVEALKPKGPMTVQAIQSKVDGEFWFIEINARFGGGCPLSMKAGADAAGALYDLLSNKKLQFQRRAANMEFTFLRFDQSIFIPQKSDGGYERTKSCHIRPGRYTLP